MESNRTGMLWWIGCAAGSILGAVAACGGSDKEEPAASSIITLEDGAHQGPITVPAGGTLTAKNPKGATVESGSGAAVIVETGPGKTTTVSGINIKSSGGAALLVKGTGGFKGETLAIEVARGLGIAAEGASSLALSDVTLTGLITAEMIPTMTFPIKGTEYPIVGLIVSKIENAAITNLMISGFGGFGAAFVGSTVAWSGGTVTGNLGVGVMQSGGAVSLTNVQIDNTWAGSTGVSLFSYGMVLSDKGIMNSKNLKVMDNEGYGVLQHDARSSHEDITVSGNKDVGLWMQKSVGTAAAPALKITGAASALTNNKGGGIFALESGGIEIDGPTLSLAAIKKITAGETGMVDMADGLQVADLKGDLTVKNTTFADNARVGVLVSGTAPEGASVSFASVSITGNGQLGLIGENGFAADTTSVSKSAALSAADAGFAGTLNVASAKANVPSVSSVGQKGLIGENGLVSETGTMSQKGLIGENGMSL